MSDFIVKVGGEGGTDSPTTAGEFITLSAIREGNSVFTLRTLPAEIKGGLATYQVRVSSEHVSSQGDGPDVLMCMNQESYDELIDELDLEGGVLVYDTDSVQLAPQNGADHRLYYGVPMTSIASDEVKERRTKNMVLLGVFSALFGLGLDTLKRCVEDKYGRRGPELVQLNHAALDAGARFVAEKLKKADPFWFQPNPERSGVERMVVDGSDAVAMGAAAAGLQVYAGYPITPASDIMHWLAKFLPQFGGTVIQTEDEIAALGCCLGASFAGAKTMSATSGPGLSLMTEMLGLGVMCELPVVVVDAQRGGPATGLPTKCENGDLNIAVLGTHGDAPRIVVAPANIRDCFYDTVGAFNLAEKYQSPVILLSDQSMAMRTQAMEPPDVDTIQRHDEHGSPSTNNGTLAAAMMDKRYRKVQAARFESGWSRTHGPETAKIGAIGWGSLEGALAEAVDRINANGGTARMLHLRMLAPLPVEEIEAFAATVDKVVVCELNFSGQLNHMIRAETDVRSSLIRKYDGVPFTPRELAAALQEELNHG
ncbi:MAG: 2-oxoacid:acceptor oxidoreductase subunit alpha [Armatimonadetes bacterium]|nr:2-oxoacid:acceptor oxidoreductase subunit alpha [Armatimonadota bacterium]